MYGSWVPFAIDELPLVALNDELTIALFVTGGLDTTLPKMMWDSAVLQVDPTLAAVSTLLLALITCVLFLAGWVGRRDRAVRG